MLPALTATPPLPLSARKPPWCSEACPLASAMLVCEPPKLMLPALTATPPLPLSSRAEGVEEKGMVGFFLEEDRVGRDLCGSRPNRSFVPCHKSRVPVAGQPWRCPYTCPGRTPGGKPALGCGGRPPTGGGRHGVVPLAWCRPGNGAGHGSGRARALSPGPARWRGGA